MQDERIIWEGSPTWKAWAADWIGGWIFLPILLGGVILLQIWVRTKSIKWRITDRKIELQSGLLTKRVDTLELWRVRDVVWEQTLPDRFAKVARMNVLSTDASTPALTIRGVPEDRKLYDELTSAVADAKRQRGAVMVVS